MKTLEQLNENSTIQDFIEFYEGIPEDKWITHNYVDKLNPECKCALGHLGCTDEMQCNELRDKFENLIGYSIASVNDCRMPEYSALGTTPKQRVINYLKSKITNNP